MPPKIQEVKSVKGGLSWGLQSITSITLKGKDMLTTDTSVDLEEARPEQLRVLQIFSMALAWLLCS